MGLSACPALYGAQTEPAAAGSIAEARRIVQEMIADPRGPYSRIRWYCNDGTVQPPVAYACQERGGGRQHAEYSDKRRRLAELGYSVGTIFAALTPEELTESQPRRQRLRELALERYLIDIDNGWVMRRARGYRGHIQVEDEEAAGRALLEALLAEEDWALDNFLLLRESVRVIPHGREDDLARSVRRTAVELAELDPAAEFLRAEIHGRPDTSTVERLRRWLAGPRSPDVRLIGQRLADDLDRLYGEEGRRERLSTSLGRLRASGPAGEWRRAAGQALSVPQAQRVADLCRVLGDARSSVFTELKPPERLSLLDAMDGLEAEVRLTAATSREAGADSRRALLQRSAALLDCAYAAGLVSATERKTIRPTLRIDADEMALDDYRMMIARLKRVPAWATGTIRHAFAEPLARYTALDARVARFPDDLLRGSAFWLFGETLRALARDADRLAGSLVDIDGREIPTAIALNSGLATGRLRVFASLESLESADIDAGDIVALPETIAELPRVAGILTLGEGNPLSHVQLLARNFGIPNVAVDFDTLSLLEPLVGQRVQLAVGSGGNVILRRDEESPAESVGTATNGTGGVLITVPEPDLSADTILRLADINRGLSGRVIGPKAANLGELNRLFPGRVAPAVAIPFGVYSDHLRAAGLQQRIDGAFAAGASGELTAAELADELAALRVEVAALRLSPATEAALREAMAAEFGEADTYGVFVRSDTNVEDLPQFTGAGLNETLPNVVGSDRQLASIPVVWSSVLSPRAVAWRGGVLANPAEIYASVLLMKSVPAIKSGVLVTRNLFSAVPGLTASAAWGVGGAVAGEAAESVVITENGFERIFEAKAPYQRHLDPAGGIDLVPAPAGPVLRAAEVRQLRALADEVRRKYAPVIDESGEQRPWDIEFGFVDGELTLFQIRPLVERKDGRADALIRRLRPAVAASPAGMLRVPLDQEPLG